MPDGWTALRAAAQGGHTDIVKLLLERKADPNLADARGATALGLVLTGGHTATVDVLRHAGAELRTIAGTQTGRDQRAEIGSDQATSLMLAVAAGHDAVVKMLLDHKADPNQAAPGEGRTPLILAAVSGRVELA